MSLLGSITIGFAALLILAAIVTLALCRLAANADRALEQIQRDRREERR